MTLLDLALLVLAAAGLASTARLAYEHHALRAAQIAVTVAFAWTGHRTRRLFINPGRRVQGRDTPKPRKAVAA